MRFRDYLEIGILIVLIIVLIIFIVKIQSDGAKCVTSPLKFAVNDYSKANKSPATCSCYFENIKILPIFANKSGTYSGYGMV